jgi:hypothetical protein
MNARKTKPVKNRNISEIVWKTVEIAGLPNKIRKLFKQNLKFKVKRIFNIIVTKNTLI